MMKIYKITSTCKKQGVPPIPINEKYCNKAVDFLCCQTVDVLKEYNVSCHMQRNMETIIIIYW